jgi:hypothetical protein
MVFIFIFLLNQILINILIQDYQLYCDLRKLEDSCARERWLTIPEDDDKWEQYAKENGFLVKSSDELATSLLLPNKNFLSVEST